MIFYLKCNEYYLISQLKKNVEVSKKNISVVSITPTKATSKMEANPEVEATTIILTNSPKKEMENFIYEVIKELTKYSLMRVKGYRGIECFIHIPPSRYYISLTSRFVAEIMYKMAGMSIIGYLGIMKPFWRILHGDFIKLLPGCGDIDTIKATEAVHQPEIDKYISFQKGEFIWPGVPIYFTERSCSDLEKYSLENVLNRYPYVYDLLHKERCYFTTEKQFFKCIFDVINLITPLFFCDEEIVNIISAYLTVNPTFGKNYGLKPKDIMFK